MVIINFRFLNQNLKLIVLFKNILANVHSLYEHEVSILPYYVDSNKDSSYSLILEKHIFVLLF